MRISRTVCTANGGRIHEIDNALLLLCVEISPDNKLISIRHEIKTPPPPDLPITEIRGEKFFTVKELEQISRRKQACTGGDGTAACVENKGTTSFTVKCGACTCAGVSFVSGICKLNKWPKE